VRIARNEEIETMNMTVITNVDETVTIECSAAAWNALAQLAKVSASGSRPHLARICIRAPDCMAYATDGHRMVALAIDSFEQDRGHDDLFADPIKAPKASGTVSVTWDAERRATLRQGATSVDVTAFYRASPFPDCARILTNAEEAEPGMAAVNPSYMKDASTWVAAVAKAEGVKTPAMKMTLSESGPCTFEAVPGFKVIIMPVRT
jgi:hypothetical protein